MTQRQPVPHARPRAVPGVCALVLFVTCNATSPRLRYPEFSCIWKTPHRSTRHGRHALTKFSTSSSPFRHHCPHLPRNDADRDSLFVRLRGLRMLAHAPYPARHVLDHFGLLGRGPMRLGDGNHPRLLDAARTGGLARFAGQLVFDSYRPSSTCLLASDGRVRRPRFRRHGLLRNAYLVCCRSAA